jgi:hypothetical protein
MAGRGSLVLATTAVLLALSTGQAAAQSYDEQQLVKVTAPSRAMAERLHTAYDVGYETDGLTSVVVATEDEIALLRAEGYEIGATISDQESIDARLAERRAAVRAENRAEAFAEGARSAADVQVPGEVTIMRAYRFENYAGKFLYIEAHSKLGTTSATTTANLSAATAGADGVFGAAVPFTTPISVPAGARRSFLFSRCGRGCSRRRHRSLSKARHVAPGSRDHSRAIRNLDGCFPTRRHFQRTIRI